MDFENMTLKQLIDLKENQFKKKKTLYERKKIYTNEIDEIYNKLRETDDSGISLYLNNKIQELMKKELKIRELIFEIDMLINQISETIYFKVPPVAYNDIIDLRRTKDYSIENMYCDDTVGQYYIYLHNTKTCVGSVDYRGYHVHEYFGDAGGFVDYEYRGNGYLYQALTLLRKMLNENKVEDFWVSANQDNIPSIKTIEKLGGILLKKSNEIFLYKVKTKNNL